MESHSHSSRVVRFGVFEFDPRSGELRKRAKAGDQLVKLLGDFVEAQLTRPRVPK
jgi:hypothetical protein